MESLPLGDRWLTLEDAKGEDWPRFLGEANRLPDLIRLDLKRPHLCGFDVLSHSRAAPWWCELAVVVLSTNRDQAARQTLSLGAKACLARPRQYVAYQD